VVLQSPDIFAFSTVMVIESVAAYVVVSSVVVNDGLAVVAAAG